MHMMILFSPSMNCCLFVAMQKLYSFDLTPELFHHQAWPLQAVS